MEKILEILAGVGKEQRAGEKRGGESELRFTLDALRR